MALVKVLFGRPRGDLSRNAKVEAPRTDATVLTITPAVARIPGGPRPPARPTPTSNVVDLATWRAGAGAA